MKSGATESSFHYLAQHYKFPENVDVKRTTFEIVQSDKQYKIIWAHDNCDQMGHRDLPQHVDKIDKIVCVSNWEREQYIKYNRAPVDKLVVIPNGVDNMFRPSGNLKSKTCIFFSAPHKGISPLIPIWKEIIKHHPDAKLKVFSSMSLYGEVQPGEGENETITTERGLEPSPFIPVYEELKKLPGVEYSPCIDREDLLPHIQDAAFYIHPNVWEETFCVSLAEAMSCGCFPITTDMGALPETSNGMGKYITMSGTNTPRGWIPDDTFHKNFAEEVIRALHFFDVSRDKFEYASSKISEFAIKNYNWKTISLMWKSLIEDITGTSINSKLHEHYLRFSDILMTPYDHIDYLYNMKYEQSIKPKVIYDIGSNCLHWSKVAQMVWKDAKIYHVDGFEPFQSLYTTKGVDYAIEVLSNVDDKVVTYYENFINHGGCSYYELNYEQFPYNVPAFKNEHYQEVTRKTKTLDTLVEQLKWRTPDLIKMDVQGCELDIIKGAVNTIKYCPHIILELQNQEYMKGAPMRDEVIHYMSSIGYKLVLHFTQNSSDADGDYHFSRVYK
jgi:FkbM family methyltransferase